MSGGVVLKAGGAECANPEGGGGEDAAPAGDAAFDGEAEPRHRQPGPPDRCSSTVRPHHRRDRGRLYEDPGELADSAECAEKRSGEPEQSNGHVKRLRQELSLRPVKINRTGTLTQTCEDK
ncbi:hypothetical protein COCON_G00163380 [Conger conger]|uniref:Uncharacterized protein n=1 Tax=Conger conger TaxID=82655 RepID=A0A9Q1HTE5_CONCO|nr:hypothetical protein COCON_G00163380 [Conger conger]